MTELAPHVLDEDFLREPMTVFRELRSRGPLHYVALPGGIRAWLVTDYDLARRALADPTLGKDAKDATALVNQQAATYGHGGFGADLPEQMLNADPPDHDRLRKLVSRAFTPPAVARMQRRIEQITAGLLDAVEERVAAGESVIDLVDAVAYPLPMTVICEMLGVPDRDRDRFRGWSQVVASSMGPDSEEVVEAFTRLMDYLGGLVVEQRANPDDSMIGVLARVAEDGDRLSEHELVSTLFLLLVAGFETTAGLIGNGLLALLRHPDQLALLRADPSRVPAAVEEMLRYDGPVTVATLRHTTAPWRAGDITLPAGEFVMVALLDANNDPARYPEPERLDIARRTGGHLAFGHGIHHCIGAPLARIEGATAFRELLARFPALALDREPEAITWRGSMLAHGLVELPVRLG